MVKQGSKMYAHVSILWTILSLHCQSHGVHGKQRSLFHLSCLSGEVLPSYACEPVILFVRIYSGKDGNVYLLAPQLSLPNTKLRKLARPLRGKQAHLIGQALRQIPS
jgi:hypothetical protein